MCRLLLLLLVSVMHRSIFADATEPACACKNVTNSYISTRLGNIVSSDWNAQSIIDEFDVGFAPIVTKKYGFQEYTSAFTGDDSNVFFMYIFETKEKSDTAQSAAQAFIRDGDLNGAVSANQYTEGNVSFSFSSQDCATKSNEGRYLSTQLWRLTPESSMSTQDVVDVFEFWHAPVVAQRDGFLEYSGATVSSRQIFLYHITDTKIGAKEANEAAALFVSVGSLNETIEEVVFTEGMIGFDYICSDNVYEPTPAPSPSSASNFLAHIINKSAAIVAAGVILIQIAVLV